jgi:hypothetical protein
MSENNSTGNSLADYVVIPLMMGCTKDEFIAWLPAASNFRSFQIHVYGTSTIIDFSSDAFSIELTPKESRKIALLEIPVLEVVFKFETTWTAELIEQFMSRFKQYTQRGGG